MRLARLKKNNVVKRNQRQKSVAICVCLLAKLRLEAVLLEQRDCVHKKTNKKRQSTLVAEPLDLFIKPFTPGAKQTHYRSYPRVCMKVVRYKADDAQPPATSSVFIPDNLLRTLEAVGVGCVADRAQQEISSPTVEDCPERRQVAVSSCHQLLKPLVVNLYLSMAVNSVLLFVFHLLAFFTPSVWSQEGQMTAFEQSG